jgi:hypothetical protein
LVLKRWAREHHL